MCIVSGSLGSYTLQPFPHPVLFLSVLLVIACSTENQWELWYVISFERYGDREDGRAKIPLLLSFTTSVEHVVDETLPLSLFVSPFCRPMWDYVPGPPCISVLQAMKAVWEPGNEAVLWLVPVNQSLSWPNTEIGNQKLAEGIVLKRSFPFQNWNIS